MALIKCPECKKEISDTIKKCPQCGYQIKPGFDSKKFIKEKKVFIAIASFLIVVIIIGYTIYSNQDSIKLKKFLTNHGYTCSKDTYSIRGNDIPGPYCKKGKYVYLVDGGDLANISLLYFYDNSHYILINEEVYFGHIPVSIYEDKEEICEYWTERKTDIGDKLSLYDYDENTEKHCLAKEELVNDIAREYEETFENAGIILKTQ